MFLIHQPDFTFARILEHLIGSRDLLKQRHIKTKTGKIYCRSTSRSHHDSIYQETSQIACK